MSTAPSGARKSEQPLQTPWTFWFDRANPGAPYSTTLQRLGTVQTVQGFWRYYCNLRRPGALNAGDNYHLFRGALQPAQETLPGGGCWLFRVKRSHQRYEAEVDRLWEKLLLSIVGETVGEVCVVGAGVSIRPAAAVLAVWCARSRPSNPPAPTSRALPPSRAPGSRPAAPILPSRCRDEGDALAITRVGQSLRAILEPQGSSQLEWRAAPTVPPAPPPPPHAAAAATATGGAAPAGQAGHSAPPEEGTGTAPSGE